MQLHYCSDFILAIQDGNNCSASFNRLIIPKHKVTTKSIRITEQKQNKLSQCQTFVLLNSYTRVFSVSAEQCRDHPQGIIDTDSNFCLLKSGSSAKGRLTIWFPHPWEMYTSCLSILVWHISLEVSSLRSPQQEEGWKKEVREIDWIKIKLP